MSLNKRVQGNLLRRYPAIVLVGVAAALALLLPSALNVPQTGPSTLAEYAPEPGESQGEGDLSELGQASSGGLGFGRGSSSSGRLGGSNDLGAPNQKKPRLKRCVGNPPRQTEDPRSPPCVAYFEGDNGGSTSKGVTREEVTVVFHLGAGSSSSPAGYTDWETPIRPDEPASERVYKAFVKYFNVRYQTYDRRVHFYGFRSSSNSETVERYRSDIARIDSEKRPFAVVSAENQQIIANESAQRRIMGVTYPGFKRADYQGSSPYLISFAPDLDDQAANAAAYVCTKIAGRKARFAPDPSIQNRDREFGLLYLEHAPDPQFAQHKEILKSELRDCGVGIKAEAATRQGPDHTTPIANLRTANVTTVITVIPSGYSTNASIAAGAQQWYPEWLLSGVIGNELGNDHAASAQLHNQAVWKGAYGMTFDYRRDEAVKQPWYQAYREACPDCPQTKDTIAAKVYDQLALLFYGIQAAGPRLSPQSLDKGLHSIPQRGSPDPYRPAAYFAPGNYSFIKDAMEIWWDGSSQAPGESPPGCYRIPNEGKRFRAPEWKGDDSQLFRDGPCQGPPAKAASTP